MRRAEKHLCTATAVMPAYHRSYMHLRVGWWLLVQSKPPAQGGKDAASARYIHTMLETSTRSLFHEADDKLLTYLSDDGQSVEPQWCECC